MNSTASVGSLPDIYRDAELLLEEAADLLNQAEAALDVGDDQSLLELIQQRGAVLRACESPLEILREAGEGADAASARAFLEKLAVLAGQFTTREDRLALSLESERDRVARELDQIEGDELIRSAYGKQTRDLGKINTVG